MVQNVRRRPKPEWIKGGITMVSLQGPLAFNQQTLLSPPPPHGRIRRLYDFRRAKEDLYLDTETIADAAVFRQFHTLAYHPAEPRYQVQMAEQTLIQAHAPFDIIFDQQRYGRRGLTKGRYSTFRPRY